MAIASSDEIEYHACAPLSCSKSRDVLRGLLDLLLARNDGDAIAILGTISAKMEVAAAVDHHFRCVCRKVRDVLPVFFHIQYAVL